MSLAYLEIDRSHKVPICFLNWNSTCTDLDALLGQLITAQSLLVKPLLAVADVAERLKVRKDWVWDHSSQRLPYLPAIRMSDGALRYRASQIEESVLKQEWVSKIHIRSI